MTRASAWLAALLFCPALQAYSVLTHEAIIDTVWGQNLAPALLRRFPGATPSDLVTAHSYAYGGCIIQDMGYYPFGSKLFSDLVHYVRSGDFILNLIAESQDLNEYAFALGSLAHYAADDQGHSIAVNPSVALQYPELRRKYGDVVTYADDPGAHLKVEFGFDVLQVARGDYAPQAYHDFIGFGVAKPLLERAFHDTYSLELSDLFTSLDLALATYRHAVSSLIPEMTRVAWNLKKDELVKARPGLTRRQFTYNLSRASYRKEWADRYQKPGIGARLLAFLIRILPKVGPLKAAAFRTPTRATVAKFEESFVLSLTAYRRSLADVERQQLQLADSDFDTGKPTAPGEYELADQAYAKLTVKLGEQDPVSINPQLRENILNFYSNLDVPFATKKDPSEWQRTLSALDRLKAAHFPASK